MAGFDFDAIVQKRDVQGNVERGILAQGVSPVAVSKARPLIQAAISSMLPQIRSSFDALVETMIPVFAQFAARKLVRGVREGEITIFSATEIWSSGPMWAHYAENRRGFVLGFEPGSFFAGNEEALPFLLPQKVTYSDSLPEIVVQAESTIDILTRKTSAWSYENEWQYIDGKPEYLPDILPDGTRLQLRDFQPAAVSEVVFGERCEAKHRAEVADGLRSLRAEPKFFELTGSGSSSGLGRERVTI